MDTTNRLQNLRTAALRELGDDILWFWASKVADRTQGGFFGAVSEDGVPDSEAGKGGVLNARILWTFSAALRNQPSALNREMADRAFDYLISRLWDAEHSGLFWAVDHLGRPADTRKQTYGQAFGIYGLAEYFRATGVGEALDRAIELFEDVETKAFDREAGGYWEARGRDWSPIDDIRLSEIDLNAPFSMNTHLHVLEAYATLALVWSDPRPRARLRAVLEIMLERVYDAATGHLVLFFDERWRPLSSVVSYGHDIEAGWLMCEAADVLGDPALSARAEAAAIELTDAVLAQGCDAQFGGIYNDRTAEGRVNTDKDWWPQAEAVVGFLNAYRLSDRREHLEAALDTWRFIDAHIVDHARGEWYTRVTRDGSPVAGLTKVDFWKCPYHDARAMLEIAHRAERLAARSH
jgi:mannobiose 2-epimerase